MNSVQAKLTLGTSFFGKEEIIHAYGDAFLFEDSSYENIFLTEEELLFFRGRGYCLLYIPKNKEGLTLSMSDIDQAFFLRNQKRLIFEFNDPYKWYNKDETSFVFIEHLSPGWVLYKTSIVEGSCFSFYLRQEQLIEEEITYLESSLSHETKVLVRKNFSRPSVIEEVFYQGLGSTLDKNFDRNRYIWTKTCFMNEYVRVGRYSEDGLEMTKRDVYDGNSMTGTCIAIKL